ncbi:MAG TPA: hypothetical protein PK141_07365 [Polyangiaceae bacterium]|nr:hypothetical protein [Polyangiaceae bacterium]
MDRPFGVSAKHILATATRVVAVGATLAGCPEPAAAPPSGSTSTATAASAARPATPLASASTSASPPASSSAPTGASAPPSASAPERLPPPPPDYVLHDIAGRGACRTAADCVPSDCCGSLTCVAKKDAPKNCNDVDCTQGGLEACTCLKGRCGARIRFRENSIPNP